MHFCLPHVTQTGILSDITFPLIVQLFSIQINIYTWPVLTGPMRFFVKYSRTLIMFLNSKWHNLCIYINIIVFNEMEGAYYNPQLTLYKNKWQLWIYSLLIRFDFKGKTTHCWILLIFFYSKEQSYLQNPRYKYIGGVR